ncbi:hypothetical protein BDY19DRAFT_533305 [Irpex rosettiformis]|uniref:Uncharacterized protein n=1 Tax=Irpex rosettiformis TaxID=378272 RepID=A0ACB8TQY9_9APHY|nr:hypothetical protein BDY19DRAFT_533305 [Irpex rosettiformis]
MAPQERYHVFSLPPSLLETLVPRTILGSQPSQEATTRAPSPPPSTTQNGAARACNICLGATFTDVDEQRVHFRSDWHRYNVKMRVAGSNAVTEAQFAKLVDSLEDSISGSETTTSDPETDDSDDAVRTLVQKAKKLKARADEDEDEESGQKIPNAPVIWFHSPPATQIGVYKSIYPSHLSSSPSSSGQEFLTELKAMQTGGGEIGRKWALFMTAGGHFAGAIIRVSKPDGEGYEESGITKRGKPKKPKPDTEVLLHKTFHRYTTRRKQGGSQSVNDNAKSKAVSAGAMLRRYGEQALRDDIRNLINDWIEELDDCERIFIRASVSNRKIFLGYEGAPLHKDDDRLRTFPFPTRRPTQSELQRCLLELTQVKVSHLTEEALRAQDEEYLAARPKPKPVLSSAIIAPSKPSQPQVTPEELARLRAEHELRIRWERATDMVERGKVDALKSFLTKDDPLGGGVNARMPDGVPDGGPGQTLLMFAARRGQEEVLRWLLEDARADPTLSVGRTAGLADVEENGAGAEEEDEAARPLVGGSRRTAYDFASTRNVRNIFRRCAADHPDWWDWVGTGEHSARVPSILSKEMEEGRDEKKKARRKGLKDKIREREALQKEKDNELEAQKVVELPKPIPAPSKPTKDDGPRKLGGSTTAQESVMGLTPEMRARIERERRARAAEARLKK